MDMSIWTDLLANFGPLASVVLFFIWRDWQREAKLFKRVEKLEEYQRDTLVDLVEKTTAILAQNTVCLQWFGKSLKNNV